jgi:hypothetical protein
MPPGRMCRNLLLMARRFWFPALWNEADAPDGELLQRS